MTPRILVSIRPLPNSVCPIISEASAMVTIPVPMLISAFLLYWPIRHPARPVSALDRQSPTVIVKPGLMELARTMAMLSPVARIDSPSRVPRKRYTRMQRIPTRTNSSTDLLQVIQNSLPFRDLNRS